MKRRALFPLAPLLPLALLGPLALPAFRHPAAPGPDGDTVTYINFTSGREDIGWFSVDNFSFRKTHSLLIVLKQLDGASPHLLEASKEHEVFPAVVIMVTNEYTRESQVTVLTNALIINDQQEGTKETLTVGYQAAERK